MLKNASAIPQTSKSKKTAVGYMRVRTPMQSEDGLSLDAQRAAIVSYCNAHNLELLNIYQDVESGGEPWLALLAQRVPIEQIGFALRAGVCKRSAQIIGHRGIVAGRRSTTAPS